MIISYSLLLKLWIITLFADQNAGRPPKQQSLLRCFEKGDDVKASSPFGEAFCILAAGGCCKKLHQSAPKIK